MLGSRDWEYEGEDGETGVLKGHQDAREEDEEYKESDGGTCSWGAEAWR